VPIQSFSHVGVCCSDLERSTSFYVNVLGFQEVFTMELGDEVAATMEMEPGIRFVSRMLRRGDLRVELLNWITPDVDSPRTRRSMTAFGMTHLCFRVDDVEELAEAIRANGGELHRDTLSELPGSGVGGGPLRLIYVTDPDGVRIEFMSGAPVL